MTSVLASPNGYYEYEVCHEQQRHYYMYLKEKKHQLTRLQTIFAWTGALRKRGELDNLPELMAFADKLEKACIDTIENGEMTEIYILFQHWKIRKLNTEEFILAIVKL